LLYLHWQSLLPKIAANRPRAQKSFYIFNMIFALVGIFAVIFCGKLQQCK
jgi:hypothetical protein